MKFQPSKCISVLMQCVRTVALKYLIALVLENSVCCLLAVLLPEKCILFL